MRLKHLLLIGMLAALVLWLATHSEPSDRRYPKMLLKELPKMPFRYFV